MSVSPLLVAGWGFDGDCIFYDRVLAPHGARSFCVLRATLPFYKWAVELDRLQNFSR
jgi:hypothetical protein